MSNSRFAKPSEIIARLDAVHRIDPRCASIAEYRERMTALTSTLGFLPIQIGENAIWYRGRKMTASKPWASLSHLSYPTDPSAGRVNHAGNPVFYASINQHTVLHKLACESGTNVQIVAIRVKPGCRLNSYVVGNLESLNAIGRPIYTGDVASESRIFDEFNRLWVNEPYLVRAYAAVDSYFSGHFRLRVKRAYEHKITRVFSDAIFEWDEPAIDAIVYPSVEALHGINIAIKPSVFDEHCEYLFCSHIESDYLQFETYNILPISVGVPGAGGDINWFATVEEGNRYLSEKYQFNLKGGLRERARS